MMGWILSAAWGLGTVGQDVPPQSPPPQTPLVETIFAEAAEVCARDQGRLWGRSLCGPILVVDRETRAIVANHPSPSLTADGDLWRGTLPPEVIIANTAVEWDGVRWTMVMAPLNADAEARAQLVTHENWHRIQPELGLPMASPVPEALSTEAGRTWLRLEWRALSPALLADSPEQARLAIADALAFRQARAEAGGAEGADQARLLELNEGLAEYTAVRLAAADPRARAVRAMIEAEAGANYARSFAYASGPAYGLLLDRFAPDWRSGLTSDSDLAALLADATSLQPSDLDAAGLRHGRTEVAQQEAEMRQRQAAIEAGWSEKLVDGPVLHLPFRAMNIGFDPSGLVPLVGQGTVYPTLTVTDQWGVLTVTDGALIDPDWSGVTVAAPSDASQLSGPGWTLTLAEGWQIVPGERPGDLQLAPAP